MSARNVYIDSNIFISPLIYERSSDSIGSRKVLAAIEKAEVTAYTSTFTWDEVVWVVRRVLGRADSIQVGERLAAYPNLRFVSASEEVIRSAQRLLSDFNIAPRDAIHVASALSKSVDVMVSDDSDLDVIEGIKREGSASFSAR
ncbi:MAG: type II toxin-antitoxin system VapC family toxin [Nitrososphaerota archaeon]|nr:type II toxin-antitoxin system VapC family toxin [Nitrososphaerota archaeon]